MSLRVSYCTQSLVGGFFLQKTKMNYYVSLFYGNPLTNIVRLFRKIIETDSRQIETRHQTSNSEQLEVNEELFNVIRKGNINIKGNLEKIQFLFRQIPQPDINAKDGNDNWNTALHLAIERNELEVVNFLLSQGADITIENGDGKTSLQLAEECNNVEIIDALKSFISQAEWPLQRQISVTHLSASCGQSQTGVGIPQ